MRTSLSFLLFAVGPILAAPMSKDSKPGPVTVRELDIKITGEAKGKITDPTVMKDANDPPKSLPTPEIAKEVVNAVKFDKEQVIYFHWSGSGGDKITASVGEGDKASEVTFTVKRGLTRDLRQHHKLFVIPKDATFKIATGK